MKIGVVTFWDGNENYGMLLQCWALQRFLKLEGHDPFVIRTKPKIYKSRYRRIIEYGTPYFILRFFYRKYLFFRNYGVELKKKKILNQRNFEGFRCQHLKFSKYTYTSLKSIQHNPPKADAYIVGSDQVWSQTLDNPNNQMYFLNFGEDKVWRIAYAPSFGMLSYPDLLTETLKQCLQRFNALSVREYAGVEICKNVGFDVEKVLDPTLLLDKDQYIELMQSSTNMAFDNFVFVYCLNITSAKDIKWDNLKHFSQDNSYSVIVTPGKGYMDSQELFDSQDVIYNYSSLEQWLFNIYKSELVVTTSFHGIVLSILLEKPFVFVPLQGEFAHTNNRVIDLLKDLDLTNRILLDGMTYSEVVQSNIDWFNIKAKLEKYKITSIKYLKGSLNENV